MTPQELKRSIIQLAIQGKLGTSSPKDGSGTDLLEDIQREKETLIRTKAIKREKPLPEIAEYEFPFDIPKNWRWVRLRDICTKIVDGDHNPPTGEKDETEYWMLSAQNVNNNRLVNLDQVRYLSKSTFDKANERTSLKKGDILFTIVATLGRSCVYEGSYNICFQRSVAVLTTLVFNYYLKYVLDSGYIQEYMVANATGTAQKGFYLNQVEKLLIPIPPLAEQKRIVAKIEELLPLIDRYEQAWNKLEKFNKRFPVDMQKSILQTAIQGKLVEQRQEEGTGEELYQQIQAEKQSLIKAGKIKKEKPQPEITEDNIPFDIPDSWKWVRIAQIVTLNPKNDIDDALETSFIPMPCVMDGFRNQHTYEIKKWKDIKKGFTHFEEGDIGVAKITPCFQNRKSVIFRNLKNGYGAGTTELTVVRTINKTVLPEYLLWFFKTDYFITNGVKSFTGTAGQQRIHKDYLATCLIPLPPLAEQKRIVAKLEEILPLCERLK